MGHLKDIANQSKIQSFPSSTFEIAGDVPAAQCTDAKLQGILGITEAGGSILRENGKFVGWDLGGKTLHITAPPANVGTYDINFNIDDFVALNQDTPAASDDNHWYVIDGGELLLTRNIQSFADFISTAGYAYTIKGGKLYSNIPSEFLAPACLLVFAPLT